jgi:hypothetical protein
MAVLQMKLLKLMPWRLSLSFLPEQHPSTLKNFLSQF